MRARNGAQIDPLVETIADCSASPVFIVGSNGQLVLANETGEYEFRDLTPRLTEGRLTLCDLFVKNGVGRTQLRRILEEGLQRAFDDRIALIKPELLGVNGLRYAVILRAPSQPQQNDLAVAKLLRQEDV